MAAEANRVAETKPKFVLLRSDAKRASEPACTSDISRVRAWVPTWAWLRLCFVVLEIRFVGAAVIPPHGVRAHE